MKKKNVSDEELKAFQDQHDADPLGVYLVEIYYPGAPHPRHAIFTLAELAHKWVDDARRKDQRELQALFVPFRLDQPKYGNEVDRDFPDITRQ